MSDDVWQRPTLDQQAEAHWLVAMAKAAIPQADHDHHGPRPCPVCGGLSPEARASNDATKREPMPLEPSADEGDPW